MTAEERKEERKAKRLAAAAKDLLWVVQRAYALRHATKDWTAEEKARSWRDWDLSCKAAVKKAGAK